MIFHSSTVTCFEDEEVRDAEKFDFYVAPLVGLRTVTPNHEQTVFQLLSLAVIIYC